MIKHSIENFSIESKILHWIIAIITIAMLSAGYFLNMLPENFQATAYMLHKSFGLSIFFLTIIRIFYIKYKGRPSLPENMPIFEKILTHITQKSLYILLLLMPLAGWIMSISENRTPSFFGLFKMPLPGIPQSKTLSHWMQQSHQIMAWVIILFIFLHLMGAIKHFFINKDKLLQKMLITTS